MKQKADLKNALRDVAQVYDIKVLWSGVNILEQELIDENVCLECGSDDLEIIGAYESRGEFWGAPCSEYVPYGYHCNDCGNSEEF